MTARLHYWYLTHPRWGRPLLVLGVLHTLALLATVTAPTASASTNAMVLNWTGLKDTYGVPLGNYYLSLPTIREQITQAGPDIGWTPDSWMAWTLHAMETMAFNVTSASILTAEAGLFIGIIALALWLMKMTVSTYWLTVIGEIARAVTNAVITVTTQLGLLAIAIPIGVFAGVVTIHRGEAGRGWTMILISLSMPALSIAIFANPAGLMYGEGGLLEFARRVGFSVAQAATPGHNGTFDGVGSGGQVDALTASLITHTVREPLQLWNFGQVVDRVGGCGAAWSLVTARELPAAGPCAGVPSLMMCGLRRAATRDIAAQAGLRVTYSTQWGTEITTAAMTHLAITTPPGTLLTSIDAHAYSPLPMTATSPFVVAGQEMWFAEDKPGLGVDVDEDALGELVRDIT